MPTRIGFRHVLPVCFLALQLVLIPREPLLARRARVSIPQVAAGYQVAAYQEGYGLSVDGLEPPPLTLIQRLAIVLNLPALVVSIPFALLFSGSDKAMIYSSLPVVLLLWHLVGRRIDRLLGFIPEKEHSRKRWTMLHPVVAAVMTSLLAIAILRTAHYHPTANTYWIGTAVMAWSIFGLSIIAAEYRRRT